MRLRFREAMDRALYGPDGFYVRNRPARHFRTSAQSPLFARALAALVVRVDAALGNPSSLDIVDVGAGGGELLDNLVAALPDAVRTRARPRPVEIDDPVIPDGIIGVLLATEWLDNVPLDLARDGRYLDDGALVEPRDRAWIDRWWPSTDEIVEIGRTRDEAWAAAIARVQRGLALCVDYGHTTAARPAHTTVAGFRDGREVEPLFDGSTDITCHVSMDSAGESARIPYQLGKQREALKQLGVDGARPPLSLAHSHPHEYVRALAEASEAATLLDPNGLGGHWWLRHEIGTRLTE